jgi:chromosome partitioning protein
MSATSQAKSNNSKTLKDILINPNFDVIYNAPRFNPNVKTRKITISLSKGGVGKTTTSANLAHGLSLEGRKVLLVDTDRQDQIKLILGYDPLLGTYDFTHPDEEKRKELSEVIYLDEKRPLLHFLAGSPSIDYWETKAKELSETPRFELNPFIKYEHVMNAFREIEDNYDYIIFDTAPGIGLMANNVLFYAEELLIPSFLSKMSEDSVEQFLVRYDQIAVQRTRLGLPPLKLKYFLPTFKTNTVVSRIKFAELEELCRALREKPDQIEGLKEVRLLQPIPFNTKLTQLPDFGKTIFEHAPFSLGGQAYGMLVEEIIKDEQK